MDPGWEVIPPEDIFVKMKLKAKIRKAKDETVKEILAGEESNQEDEDSNEEDVNLRAVRFLALPTKLETGDGTCPRSSNLPLETQQTDSKQRSRLATLHEPDANFFKIDSDEDDDNITNPDNGLQTPARKMQLNHVVRLI